MGHSIGLSLVQASRYARTDHQAGRIAGCRECPYAHRRTTPPKGGRAHGKAPTVDPFVYHSEPAHGGHFAPFEVPDSYASELRAFFRPFR
ncbi:hypothetical protein [Gordonia otitidis]|uniref:Epoxide hydrolase n=1 Tax=Gordonia otitidis (strain DSM 44809 / CCUG 52243 / JCM 12355 / NBRC 100426 / IFM 10032) TaxID=1108044 RepID=H5TN10_GORO1|nr:hypothetical protein [Gordonia otitidis]GAB34868.1 hypothetical protein GOOTI_128_00110 [Gordonia otitidis NBRC 100426]